MYKAGRSEDQHRIIYISYLISTSERWTYTNETPDVFPVVASLPTTGNTSAVRRLHLVPSEYSSFDHFPKSNLPNENIKVT